MPAWTDSEIETVIRMYHGGSTDEEIAKELGRTTGSVSNIRQAKGIQRPADKYVSCRPWSKEELEKAQTLYENGWPRDHIAASVGRSRIAIKRMADQEGWIRLDSPVIDVSQFDTESETWMRVSDLRYAVSSCGRVLSLIPSKVGNILSQWVDHHGYHHVTLQIDGETKRHSVHVLVCKAFHGEKPTANHEVGHRDGNPANNAEWNLRWVTPKENAADRIIHGTTCQGSKNCNSKINEETAMEIIRLRAEGMKGKDVAARLGCSKHVVYQVSSGSSWKHVRVRGTRNMTEKAREAKIAVIKVPPIGGEESA